MKSYPKSDFIKDKKKLINSFWKWVPPKLRALIIIVGAIFFFLLAYILCPIISAQINKKVGHAKNDQASERQISQSIIEKTDNNSDRYPSSCMTGNNKEWLPFSVEHWQGLNANFLKINDSLYSLSSPSKGVDAIAFYSKPCADAFTVEFKIIPYSENLMNFNLYYESWFRWEIGGNDMRSVRLFKNSEGCRAMKRVKKIKTKEEYLPDHDKIMPEQPVLITFSVFPTKSGKLKTQIDLEYISAITKEEVTVNGRFYYEFDMSWNCDENTVLDINTDTYRIGVGLQRSSLENREIPKIGLEKFRIKPFRKLN
ncbi:hypothetical protein ISS85_00495 [Candidatus Microgenomates bacterium]|nr:hypothetical protein [Candidatus Microgenomates bacterium]